MSELVITNNKKFNNLDDITNKFNLSNVDFLTCEKYEKYNNDILDIFNSESIEPHKYDLTNPTICRIIALYYAYVMQNDEDMIKYYLISVSLNCVDSMNCLANYYGCIKKFDEMEKLHLIAIDLNYTKSMNDLACHYYNMLNYDLAVKYFLMAINLNDEKAMNNLKKMHSAKYKLPELYNILKNVTAKNDLIIKNLNILKQDFVLKLLVNKDKHKIAIENNIFGECAICYEDKLHVNFNDCTHGTCFDCYKRINICPLCRTNIY